MYCQWLAIIAMLERMFSRTRRAPFIVATIREIGASMQDYQ
jgi:hypothetical protein